MGKHGSHNSLLCLHRIFKLFLSVFKYSWRVFYTRTHTRMITCSFWCVSYQLCLTFYFKNRIKHKKSCHCRWGLRFRVECRLWNPLGLSSAEATTQTHTYYTYYIYVCSYIICCLYSANEHPLHSDFNCWAASGLSPSCLPAAIRAYEHEFLLR